MYRRYYRQILAPKVTSKAIQREMLTLCAVLDHLLDGQILTVADIAAQRLKSLELLAGGSPVELSSQLDSSQGAVQPGGPRGVKICPKGISERDQIEPPVKRRRKKLGRQGSISDSPERKGGQIELEGQQSPAVESRRGESNLKEGGDDPPVGEAIGFSSAAEFRLSRASARGGAVCPRRVQGGERLLLIWCIRERGFCNPSPLKIFLGRETFVRKGFFLFPYPRRLAPLSVRSISCGQKGLRDA